MNKKMIMSIGLSSVIAFSSLAISISAASSTHNYGTLSTKTYCETDDDASYGHNTGQIYFDASEVDCLYTTADGYVDCYKKQLIGWTRLDDRQYFEEGDSIDAWWNTLTSDTKKFKFRLTATNNTWYSNNENISDITYLMYFENCCGNT